MKLQSVVIIVSLLVLALAAPAGAQNRLSAEAGGFFPLSDLGDITSTSGYIGARIDIQDLNPLGQVALLGIFGRVAFAPLVVKDEIKSQLANLGRDDSSSYFEATLGLKAHSAASPFFVSAQAGYANYSPPGSDSKSGFATGVGLGTDFGGPALHISLEGRANFAFMSDIDNIQFLTLTASVGFPF
jgi:hypothetical protein